MNNKPYIIVAIVGATFIGIYFLNQPVSTHGEQVEILDPNKVIVLRTPGGLLEVATLIVNEEYSWKTTWECPLINCSILGETVSTIRIPAHYTYRIPLSEKWELVPHGNLYVVKVPGLQPTLPVAVNLKSMEIKASKDWFSPNATANQQVLFKHLGPYLEAKAKQQSYIDMQKNEATKAIIEFSRKWMKEQYPSEISVQEIRVEFAR